MSENWKHAPGMAKVVGYLGCWGVRTHEMTHLQILSAAESVYELKSRGPEALANAITNLGPKERKRRAARNFPKVFGVEIKSGRNGGDGETLAAPGGRAQPIASPSTETVPRRGQTIVEAIAAEIGVDPDRLASGLRRIAALDEQLSDESRPPWD